ncbi:hypothetical protein ACVBEG_27520 [Pseudomonas sp. GG8]
MTVWTSVWRKIGTCKSFLASLNSAAQGYQTGNMMTSVFFELECFVNSSLLVEVDAHALQVEIDLIYAGADNLAGTPIYQDPRCFVPQRRTLPAPWRAVWRARHIPCCALPAGCLPPAYAQLLLWQALHPGIRRDPTLSSHAITVVAVELTFRRRRPAAGHGHRFR